MPPKKNPLKLNKLQTRTLLLMQELSRDPASSTTDPESGDKLLNSLPQPHGDHVHIGSVTVSARDASGFSNEAVWKALERKGLIRVIRFPVALALTTSGQTYDTGLNDKLTAPSDH